MHSYRSILSIILNQWTSNSWQSRAALRQGYLSHYAHVRAVVPPENLLEFKPQDGWQPLCNFLGKDIPIASVVEGTEGTSVDGHNREKEPFPKVNDGASVVKVHGMLYWWRLGTVVMKMLGTVGAIGVAVWAAWLAKSIYS